MDDASLSDQAEIRWSDHGTYPLDTDTPAVRVRVPARRVQAWTLLATDRITRRLPSFTDGRFRMVEHDVRGDFVLTPPLPDPDTLLERLSESVETIELVPYANTLLRLTVFPSAG